jgi:hypothetical protein
MAGVNLLLLCMKFLAISSFKVVNCFRIKLRAKSHTLLQRLSTVASGKKKDAQA